jgi:hypothetical protein
MKSINEIRTNAVNNRYLYIFLSSGLFCGLLFFESFNWIIFSITVILFLLLLISNEYLNEENIGLIAVAHMVLIISMIGFGDYYSSNGNRLENLANFLAPLFFSIACYGFFLSRKD